jgi:hypothetical protein
MSGERFVDVMYRGLELGRRLKVSEFGPTTAYLEHGTPMPVGAPLEIVTDEGVRFSARVVRIHEQVGGAEHAPGMRIAPQGLDAAASEWWKARIVGPDRDVPGSEPVRATASASAMAASAAVSGSGTPVKDIEDVVSGSTTLEMKAVEVDDDGDVSDEMPTNGTNGNGGGGGGGEGEARPTQVMSVVEIQAIVDQGPAASVSPTNGHGSGAAADDSGDGDDGDAAASGSHAIARGKPGKKKRRRK